MCTARDIRFGYSFTDLCLEDGEICGVLLVKEEAMEYIRVLVRSAENGSLHTQPVLTAPKIFPFIFSAMTQISVTCPSVRVTSATCSRTAVPGRYL